MTFPYTTSLVKAFGYTGRARFFGCYWMPGGDEFMLSDGRITHEGNFHSWLAYTAHPAVMSLGPSYVFGSSEEEAICWLVIDRVNFLAHKLTVAEAQSILKDQWPVVTSVEAEQLAQEFLDRLNLNRHSMADIRRVMAEQANVTKQLIAELDHWWAIRQS